MATSEKLIYTCRNATPLKPRVCYGVTLAGGTAVNVRASLSLGGTVRQSVLTPDEVSALRVSSAGQGDLAPGGGVTVGCLAVQESLTLWLNSPLTSRTKAEKVLPSLLDIQLPFPVEDCLYRFVEFRRTPEGTISALVCAARREAIQACLERYRVQGIDPMLLDHEGLALWTQSLVEWPAAPSRKAALHRALICLANDRTTLVIGRGERYGNAYSLQMPALSAAPANPESVEGRNASNGALVNRLQRILHADLPAGAGVQWLFCGVRAGESDLVDALYRPMSSVWPGPLAVMDDPSAFLARALCRRALKSGPLRCNLRRQSFTHAAVLRVMVRRARFAAMIILLSGILLGCFSLAAHLASARRFDRVKSEIAAVAGELAPGATILYGREIPEVQKAWEKQSPQTTPFLDAFAPSLAVRLAGVIKAGRESSVRFETLNLKRNSLVLTGVTEDWDRCGQLEQRLKALGYTVKLERQEAVAEAEVRFTVNAEGGGP